jgi:single-strand DNA-binding protein
MARPGPDVQWTSGDVEQQCRPRYVAVQRCSLPSAPTPAVDAGSGPEHPADREGDRTVNKVLLTGRLTRDPEMRSLASGKNVTTFTVASNEFIGGGREKAEYSNVVTWDRLAEIAGTYLGKGQQVAIEGRLQTRSWDDDRGQRHWKTEVVASHVEMLSGRRKKDYAAEQAAGSLVAQAEQYGEAPPSEPLPESAGSVSTDHDADDEDEEAGSDAAA